MAEEATATADSIDRVAIKMPPFWVHDPELWFRQVEGQFAVSGITSDDTKFNYVLGNLEARYAAEARDILMNPPPSEKYKHLKTELIRRLSTSQVKKTRQLLEHEEMGDRKPSQFLRHLRSLAGMTVPDDLLKTIWLGRLPASMQAILTTQADAGLDKMAELADTITDAMPEKRHVAAVSNEPIGPLTEQLALLATQLGEMMTGFRQEVAALGNRTTARGNRPRERRSSIRSRSRSRGHGRDGVCWYHWRFGVDATKCEAPCGFRAGNDQGGR